MLSAPASLLNRLLPAKAAGPVILEIDLDRGVLKSVPTNPLQAFRAINSPTLSTLVEALRKAASDDRVAGLVVHVGTCPTSPATVDELGDAIESFGVSKPTIAYTESFGEMASGMLAYRLACRAQQIWLQPSGAVGLGGSHIDMLLLRGGFEKLGVTPEFGQRKEYKSAAETYAGKEVSDANREMMQRIADSIVEDTVALVARRRSMTSEKVRGAIDAAHLTAQQALEQGFVDSLGYRDEVYAALRTAWGEDATLQYAARYSGTLAARIARQFGSHGQPSVAVVDIHGAIVQGRGAPASPMGGQPQAGSEVVLEHLRAAVKDDDVKAVVLSVDSPGGSYIASDAIRRGVQQVRDSGRPVVVTMGDVAASGGYFVSMAANEIVANPTTLTGSIGVLAGKLVTQGLFEKLGLIREDVKAGAQADFLAGNRGFTEEQWDLLNAWLDEVYADFTTKAAHDRGLALDDLEAVAKGRVWTGSDALENHLVDRLGGRETAINRACTLASLDRDRVHVASIPALGVLERLRPADSSEQPGGMEASADLSLEGMLTGVLSAAGLTAAGPLSLPWRMRLR